MVQEVLDHLTSNLAVIYGSTELVTWTMKSQITSMEDLQWLMPWSDRTVEIVDDDGRACPENTAGNLRVQLASFDYQSYLGDPQATSRMFRDGWFYPGDMATQRADGKIRVLGRSVDVLNIKGQKMAVAPIEQIGRAHV
jgi:acyl-coenzyme A synthetase/AMP-(fatty) acid ligase